MKGHITVENKGISKNNNFKTTLENAIKAQKTLKAQNGKGSVFLGWLNLPIQDNSELIKQIKNQVKKVKLDAIVVIGIGGSYLGARAVIEALKPHYFDKKAPEVIFAGYNLNGVYFYNLLDKLENLDYGVIVISKSGTTTEPSIVFRIIREKMLKKYSVLDIKDRIIVITDKSRGVLCSLAQTHDYAKYVIPDNVGGRFSVLSPVGLLPIAFAGYDIEELLKGAADMAQICDTKVSNLKDLENNPAIKYAVLRNYFYECNYVVETLVNYNDEFHYFAEWWKQLFGESEGKDGKGIFPASVNFTSDLHSLGQFIQGGKKILFETILNIEEIKKDVKIPMVDDDVDNLNYLAGKTVNYVNKVAQEATINAHICGNVPNIIININEVNEYYIGQLIYFFEYACAISAYILDVNPFDQPDVETYKKNMFKMLGKPRK
ncbi:MAG: glucose-6-phosphate isomerase [Bacteroidales bacterium]|jgi:glucose-6-phosphate isomerase